MLTTRLSQGGILGVKPEESGSRKITEENILEETKSNITSQSEIKKDDLFSIPSSQIDNVLQNTDETGVNNILASKSNSKKTAKKKPKLKSFGPAATEPESTKEDKPEKIEEKKPSLKPDNLFKVPEEKQPIEQLTLMKDIDSSDKPEEKKLEESKPQKNSIVDQQLFEQKPATKSNNIKNLFAMDNTADKPKTVEEKLVTTKPKNKKNLFDMEGFDDNEPVVEKPKDNKKSNQKKSVKKSLKNLFDD